MAPSYDEKAVSKQIVKPNFGRRYVWATDLRLS